MNNLADAGRLSERIKVVDILDKMSFFQGQRAGRELWNDKPRNVQEKDLDNFNRDIRTIRDYILALENELKSYRDLEEQGLLLRLPCPKETTVYLIEEEWEDDGKYYYIDQSGFDMCMIEDLGRWVFLNKAEAEKALKKMREE